MSELSRFSAADQELLVGLFYRVGNWMSHIDDTDTGEESEDIEQKQMMAVLAKVSRAEGTAALVRDVATETLRQKNSWSRWAKSAADVLADIPAALVLLKGQGTEDELASFRKALMLIATAVARAYREVPEQGVAEKGSLAWLAERAGEVMTAAFDREAYKDLNISPEEDTALTQLLETLRV